MDCWEMAKARHKRTKAKTELPPELEPPIEQEAIDKESLHNEDLSKESSKHESSGEVRSFKA